MRAPAGSLKFLAFSIGVLCSAWAHGQSVEEDELALAYGDLAQVSIATGTQQPLARAPAVASVITARDITAMGATDLDQVLESVAGLHVSVWGAPLNPTYMFRGIASNYNTQVLMLVNGMRITSAFIGNRGQAWGGLPLENISRIEIIRGPGSALYGADAFSGVINIITKTAAEVNGLEYGARAGTFHERDGWLQYGATHGDLQVAAYLRAGRTDSNDRVVEKDLQSLLDGLFGTHASLAPGRINARRKAFDARIDLAYENWRLRAAYQQREVGIGVGLADALDPYGTVPERRSYIDLTYARENIAPHWDLTAVLGTYNLRNDVGDPAYTLFPAGAFGGAFPTGAIGNPGHAERTNHASVSLVYTNLDKHRIRMGSGYREEDLYGAYEYKNFNFVVVPGVGPVLLPLPGVVDARTDAQLLYIAPHKRHLYYGFIQDEWSLAKDWTLTAGVRYDRYSDFGGTTNPRLALVWDASYNLIVKAMHGRAFREPNFTEEYSRNNPVNVGNPNLRPEIINTDELAFAWQPTTNLSTNLSLFHYRMSNIIIAASNADPSTGKTFQNTGDQTGRGLELEANWDPTRALRVTGNFSLQHSTDGATGQDAGLAPHQRWFGRLDWRLAPYWQLGASFNHVAGRARQPGDTRPAVADYSTTDLSVRREKIAGNWELRATVLNLFNRDVREPSISPGNIPFDIPMPGRAFTVQLSHKL